MKHKSKKGTSPRESVTERIERQLQLPSRRKKGPVRNENETERIQRLRRLPWRRN